MQAEDEDVLTAITGAAAHVASMVAVVKGTPMWVMPRSCFTFLDFAAVVDADAAVAAGSRDGRRSCAGRNRPEHVSFITEVSTSPEPRCTWKMEGPPLMVEGIVM